MGIEMKLKPIFLVLSYVETILKLSVRAFALFITLSRN